MGYAAHAYGPWHWRFACIIAWETIRLEEVMETHREIAERIGDGPWLGLLVDLRYVDPLAPVEDLEGIAAFKASWMPARYPSSRIAYVPPPLYAPRQARLREHLGRYRELIDPAYEAANICTRVFDCIKAAELWACQEPCGKNEGTDRRERRS